MRIKAIELKVGRSLITITNFYSYIDGDIFMPLEITCNISFSLCYGFSYRAIIFSSMISLLKDEKKIFSSGDKEVCYNEVIDVLDYINSNVSSGIMLYSDFIKIITDFKRKCNLPINIFSL